MPVDQRKVVRTETQPYGLKKRVAHINQQPRSGVRQKYHGICGIVATKV